MRSKIRKGLFIVSWAFTALAFMDVVAMAKYGGDDEGNAVILLFCAGGFFFLRWLGKKICPMPKDRKAVTK